MLLRSLGRDPRRARGISYFPHFRYGDKDPGIVRGTCHMLEKLNTRASEHIPQGVKGDAHRM
jgi:hypothetical protein